MDSFLVAYNKILGIAMPPLNRAAGALHNRWNDGFFWTKRPNPDTNISEEHNVAIQTIGILKDLVKEGEKVVFFAIEVGMSPADTVHDIGLTIWSPHIFGATQTRHWQLRQVGSGEDSSEFSQPDDFIFGETEIVDSGKITQVIDTWLLSVSALYKCICAVTYNRDTLNNLGFVKSISSNVSTMCINELLRGSPPPTLSEAIIAHAPQYRSQMENCGNKAYFLMLLFQNCWGHKTYDEGVWAKLQVPFSNT
jgi:hypothetical protein